MKRVSFDGCEYRFYAPNSWKCNMSDKLTEAYLDVEGKPNVTVTSFAPDMPVTAEEYINGTVYTVNGVSQKFVGCKELYAKELSGYSFVSIVDGRIDDRGETDYIPAKKFTYTAVYSEKPYKIMQTIFVYNDMVYSITYTALATQFEAHLNDVNAMLGAFRFR